MIRHAKGVSRGALLLRFRETRAATESIAAPLSAEDQLLQSMPACSPVKWHRAHTTWFFETFFLAPNGVAPVDAAYAELFNSYYEAVGPRVHRGARGLLSRPSLSEIAAYRRIVDARVVETLMALSEADFAAMRPVVELGLAHEQQHQELMFTDVLHAFAQNPLGPTYREPLEVAASPPSVAPVSDGPRFIEYDGGLVEIGAARHDVGGEFVFDNECPRHKTWLNPFAMATRPVTVREWRAFASDRGYETASLWLSDGYDFVNREKIRAPLYTRFEGGALVAFGLEGERPLRDEETLAHVSYYEADAIARYLGARLPTEAEWEHAKSREVNPRLNNVWEWTSSAYVAYPGFEPEAGALGEYNGKFMVNQMVLRGGSRFTPRGHIRTTYRNFWGPETRFQASGLRLARSVPARGGLK